MLLQKPAQAQGRVGGGLGDKNKVTNTRGNSISGMTSPRTRLHLQRRAQAQDLRVEHEQLAGQARLGEVYSAGAGAVLEGTTLLGGRGLGWARAASASLEDPGQGRQIPFRAGSCCFQKLLDMPFLVCNSNEERKGAPPY